MKHTIMLSTLLLICLAWAETTLAETNSAVRLHHESKDDVTGAGIAIEWPNFFDGLSRSSFVLTPGFSVGMLDADTPLTLDNRETIYPAYVYLSASAKYIISPFFEAGFDLGDLLVHEVFENEEAVFNIDTYYSAGIKVALHKRVGASVYYKAYQLVYQEESDSDQKHAYPEVVGISVSFQF